MSYHGAGRMQFLAGALCNPGEGMTNVQKSSSKTAQPRKGDGGISVGGTELLKNPLHLLPLPPRLLLNRIWGMQEGENSLLLFLGGVWVGFGGELAQVNPWVRLEEEL